jgi:hypothetical protein
MESTRNTSRPWNDRPASCPLKVIWVNPPTRKTSSVVLYLDPPRSE